MVRKVVYAKFNGKTQIRENNLKDLVAGENALLWLIIRGNGSSAINIRI